MSLIGIKQEIELALRQLDERLLTAETKLLAGAAREKVEAAAELAFLQRQKRGLERQLAELDHLPEGRWDRMRLWLKEEAAIIERRLSEWTAHH
jgi:hypothetical protein